MATPELSRHAFSPDEPMRPYLELVTEAPVDAVSPAAEVDEPLTEEQKRARIISGFLAGYRTHAYSAETTVHMYNGWNPDQPITVEDLYQF